MSRWIFKFIIFAAIVYINQLYSQIFDADTVLIQPPFSKPAFQVPYKEPVMGSTLERITNSSTGNRINPIYSELQVWNADQSRMILSTESALALHDANDYTKIRSLPYMPGARWSPTDPEIIYFTNDRDFRMYNITSQNSTTLRTFSNTINRDQSHQELSDDGRFVALCLDAGGKRLVIYDVINDSVHCNVSLPRDLDWVAMSPSGKYAVVSYGTGEGEGWGFCCYTTTGVYVGQAAPNIAHSDIITVNDEEWIVIDNANNYLAYQDDHYIVAGRIPDGFTKFQDGDPSGYKKLLRLDWFHNMHISGKASWITSDPFVVVGTYNSDNGWNNGWQALEQEIFALYLDSTPSDPHIARLSQHRSTAYEGNDADYWSQPHATISRDGSKVIYGSNWNNLSEKTVDSYIIYLDITPPVGPRPPKNLRIRNIKN